MVHPQEGCDHWGSLMGSDDSVAPKPSSDYENCFHGRASFPLPETCSALFLQPPKQQLYSGNSYRSELCASFSLVRRTVDGAEKLLQPGTLLFSGCQYCAGMLIYLFLIDFVLFYAVLTGTCLLSLLFQTSFQLCV